MSVSEGGVYPPKWIQFIIKEWGELWFLSSNDLETLFAVKPRYFLNGPHEHRSPFLGRHLRNHHFDRPRPLGMIHGNWGYCPCAVEIHSPEPTVCQFCMAYSTISTSRMQHLLIILIQGSIGNQGFYPHCSRSPTAWVRFIPILWRISPPLYVLFAHPATQPSSHPAIQQPTRITMENVAFVVSLGIMPFEKASNFQPKHDFFSQWTLLFQGPLQLLPHACLWWVPG